MPEARTAVEFSYEASRTTVHRDSTAEFVSADA